MAGITQTSNGFSPKNALGVIALFVGIVEIAFAYPVTVLSGTPQSVFVGFMVAFPILVLLGFFIVLIRYPENFYSPSEFQDPQLFAQLVARRDNPINEHLRIRTAEIVAMNKALLRTTEENSQSLDIIAKRLDDLPELDRATLELDMLRMTELLDEAKNVISANVTRALESYSQHALLGIRRIWFDMETFNSRWSLDFLIDVAVDIMKDIQKQEIRIKGGTGSVEARDGDYLYTFSYRLTDSEYGSSLIIRMDGGYCTTG